MKRLLELAWAVLCAWMIHGIYTGSKERAAAAAREDAQPVAAQAAAEQPAPTKDHATKGDKWALFFAVGILFLSIAAVLLIKPSEFTRDSYLATVFAVAGLTGVVLGISKIVERFRPESRFFATFERCMLLIAVLWASVAAIVAAKAG